MLKYGAFAAVSLKKFSKCIHHVSFILADINQNISITKFYFICDTSVAIKNKYHGGWTAEIKGNL